MSFEQQAIEQRIFHDRDIAKLLGYTQQWVRHQRMLRRQGKPHVLEVDAIEISGRPRYLAEAVTGWLDAFIEKTKRTSQ